MVSSDRLLLGNDQFLLGSNKFGGWGEKLSPNRAISTAPACVILSLGLWSSISGPVVRACPWGWYFPPTTSLSAFRLALSVLLGGDQLLFGSDSYYLVVTSYYLAVTCYCLFRFALLCFFAALLWVALFCFALLCFAFLFFALLSLQ